MIESVLKKPPTKKGPGPQDFTGESYQTSQELTPILLKLFQIIEVERHFLIHSMTPALPHYPITKVKDATRKENYSLVFLININAKIIKFQETKCSCILKA